jgi:tetratricopeptide (TPR) repeat protein
MYCWQRRSSNTLLIVCITLGTLAACANRIDTPQSWQNSLLPGNTKDSLRSNSSQEITAVDLAAEDAISKDCVAAWRKALAGNEKGAMAQLKALNQKYPKVATIRFMIGQVLEHDGKKTEAIQYYKDAVRDFEFSSIHLYKLAEAMRTTGDASGSISQYRKLLQAAPDFVDGRLGLAKALLQLDPKSTEAKEQLHEVLKGEPGNPDALAMLAARTEK